MRTGSVRKMRLKGRKFARMTKFRELRIPIRIDGRSIGAAGVSGVQSTEDEQCAKTGVEALN